MMTADDAFRFANQYYQSGQLASAEQMFRYALQLEPDHAGALYALGLLAFHACNWGEAVAWLRQATRAKPGEAEYWHNLAVACSKEGYFIEAVAACEQALLLRPHFALAANDLGLLHKEMGQIKRAIICYQRALSLQPKYADAHINLASALIEEGQSEEAVAHYRDALRIEPDHVHAYYSLSQLATQGKYSFAPADLQQMHALLRAEQLPILSRSVVGFALGNVLDAQGMYDEAFACFQQANELRRAYQWANKQGFDAEQYRTLVNEAMATFDDTYFHKVASWGTDTKLPIFILGMPRSGTSLAEQILASHPAVYGAGELSEIPRILGQLMGPGRSNALPRPAAFSNREAAQDFASRYLQRLRQLGTSQNPTRISNKNLTNALYLGLIATAFARAQLLWCRRDPRDVCLSCYFQNFQYMEFSWSFEEIAFYYGQYERLMAHWCHVLPLPIYEVCYEDLIANQEHVTRGLLTHCGLPWDERCLEFYNTSRAVQTASTIQVRRPLSAKAVGRWKHYQAHLGPLLEALKVNEVEVEKNRDAARSLASTP